MLIGLLFVALVCIVLGVVFASGPWFVGSLVASVLAGYLLWRQREQISGRAAGGDSGGGSSGTAPATATRQTSLVTGTAFAGKTTEAAAADKPTSSAADPSDGTVWVVDGQPEYHSETCGRIEDLDAEAVPYAQAIEDGFIECEFCHPVVAAGVRQVWVLDGRPEYHVEDCSHLADAAGEQIPRAQAVEDGFTPCLDCRPDGSAPATSTPQAPAADEPAAAEPANAEPAAAEAGGAEVWVVDGRPRYHLQDCMIIEGQSAEAISLGQATEDGFMPCSMCEPNVSRV